LEAELKERGLVVLAVTADMRDPEMLTVALHGNASQWVDGAARRRVASVVGVVEVSETATPTILRVRVKPDDSGSGSMQREGET
jgi:hypothetical protein